MPERNTVVAVDNRIELRIGINLGDVIVDGDDLYGDGVNIAARIEALADAGGVFVSNTVHDQVRDRLPFAFEDLGEQQVKNIARPVRVYRVRDLTAAKSPAQPALPLPDKPSIAVLPFANMSGDPEQEYFADGMVEEITTAISRLPWLFVIARNSAFTYKGKPIDVKQVARELGVRYVLEGSVRKAGNRVRITGQLIDTTTGAHIWAERFDGALDDVFELQDQVASNVVGAIEPKLIVAETERAIRKPTDNLGAYDLYLRALAQFQKLTQPGRDAAIALLTQALAIDPSYAPLRRRSGGVNCFTRLPALRFRRPRSPRACAWRPRSSRPGRISPTRCGWRPIHCLFSPSACDGGGHDRPCPHSQSQFGQCLVRSWLGRGDAGSGRPGDRGIATRDTPQPARPAALAVCRRNIFCASGGEALRGSR